MNIQLFNWTGKAVIRLATPYFSCFCVFEVIPGVYVGQFLRCNLMGVVPVGQLRKGSMALLSWDMKFSMIRKRELMI